MWQSFADRWCSLSQLSVQPANKVMTPTHTHTPTHTYTHTQVNAFVLGKENKGQHLARTRQLQVETRKLPQFNLAKRRKHEKGEGVRSGGGVGRCCQLCEILVRKQSEKDFCNLFKSRATFSIQAKAMSKAGKASWRGGWRGRKGRGRGRFKGKAGGIFSYLQQ